MAIVRHWYLLLLLSAAGLCSCSDGHLCGFVGFRDAFDRRANDALYLDEPFGRKDDRVRLWRADCQHSGPGPERCAG